MGNNIVSLFIFRRDLRLHDNHALYKALLSGYPVLPVFIFDANILSQLPNKQDARVNFIYQQIAILKATLQAIGSDLMVLNGKPIEVLQSLIETFSIRAVYFNRDYEGYAIDRDSAINSLFGKNGIPVFDFKDQVIFDTNEVVKEDGKPYTVFTPYSKKWRTLLQPEYYSAFNCSGKTDNFFKCHPVPMIPLENIGFEKTDIAFPKKEVNEGLIKSYHNERDFPAKKNGTSKLGIHLRFGTISIRELVAQTIELNNTYVNELIWRDFYHQIAYHFPQINKGHAFRPAYDNIAWRNNEAEFERWCSGQTGYPIVDAGMRELATTGYMHNRVRMIVASFLCKHLLIDWRWGEAWFAEKLLDFDFAANNGGWQWASSSGCDAAPYFRIFNPALQTKKFDPNLEYIRKWVPEFESLEYGKPMIDHEFARKRCLDVYTKAVKSA